MITDCLMIFSAQFVTVFLLGIQSLMVRDTNYLGAALGAFLIGITQFFLFGTIGQLGADDVMHLRWWSFITAGPMAICLSMALHPHIKRIIGR